MNSASYKRVVVLRSQTDSQCSGRGLNGITNVSFELLIRLFTGNDKFRKMKLIAAIDFDGKTYVLFIISKICYPYRAVFVQLNLFQPTADDVGFIQY